MNSLIIKKADSNNLLGIMEVEKDAFDPEIQECYDTFYKRLTSYNDGFFIAIDNDNPSKVAGYYCSELWNYVPTERSSFELNHDCNKSQIDNGSVLYISSIALKSEYKGKGFGSRFFYECTKQIFEENRNIRQVVLLVNELWKSAISIYKKKGFTQYGILDKFFVQNGGSYYSDGLLFKTDRAMFLGEENDK